MKPKFNLEDYLYGDYAMHCPEEWQAKIFYRYLASCDFRLPAFDVWNKYKEKTCYNLQYTSEYSPEEWFRSIGYTILEFDDFDWDGYHLESPSCACSLDFPIKVCIEAENDPVNHPAHYTDGKIEVAEFINDKKLNYNRGNVIKYICRAGKKDPDKELEDLEKALWYLRFEIKMLGGAE